MRKRKWVGLFAAVLALMLLAGCGGNVPSASFDDYSPAPTVEKRAEDAVVSHENETKASAKKSADKAKEKVSEGISNSYDTFMEEISDLSDEGIVGVGDKLLYRGYLLYYTLVDYAIPIMCIGWALALFFYLTFKKIPTLRRFGIMVFGVGTTGIVICVLFLPSVITSLGK